MFLGDFWAVMNKSIYLSLVKHIIKTSLVKDDFEALNSGQNLRFNYSSYRIKFCQG